MTDCVLTLNAGSSSLKFALFDAGATASLRLAGQVDGLGSGAQPSSHADAVAQVLRQVSVEPAIRLVAVGHRVVHGGTVFDQPALINPAVLTALQALAPLAPLHQPHNLAGIAAAQQAFAGVPQVACFDTAFHRHQPQVQQRFALPERWHQAGIQRYGFHGLSYQSICEQLAAVEPALAQGKLVVAHLGNGASMCAIEAGRSITATMSFSPLDGLTMGTRCGRLDPAAVLHLIDHHGLSSAAVSRLLQDESGLLGLSGESADMRQLLASPSAAAALAIEHFVESVLRELGGLSATLRGIDGLVFTGGIGQHAASLRARICTGAAWLGIAIDEAANRAATAENPRLNGAGSRVQVRVMQTNEEAVIARQTLAAVARPKPT